MASRSLIFTLIISLSFFISPTISNYSHAATKAWCSQTPYPQPCEYFFTRNPNYKLPIKSKHHFFKMSTRLALDRCFHALDNLYSLGPKCGNEREKAAWADCVELYELTIQKINKTLDPNNVKCTPVDAQTWLSTALTNIETCQTGFFELGVVDNVLPLMENNVSMLLSNTLALNHGSGGLWGTSYKKGFPPWVKPHDRKLLQLSSPQVDVVVAQDGSGTYRTVSEAVLAAGRRSGNGRYVIYVKEGTYSENVNIGSGLVNITLLGDGIGKTIITGNISAGGAITTFRTATVAVVGDRFIARGITFRNTAGAINVGQAVALRSGSDYSVFYQCSFEGYQDTLYVHSERQFYRECDIYGTVDFIFGNAAVVFQNCTIYARDPPNRINTVTAQSRTDPSQNTGISIHECRVRAAADLEPVQSSVRTYLGRPWQIYSRTVFMKTFLDSLIDPEGWMPWDGRSVGLDTLFYGEYENTGPGSSTANRVKWKGYRVITSAAEASDYTVGQFIGGDTWLPNTTVPFYSGL